MRQTASREMSLPRHLRTTLPLNKPWSSQACPSNGQSLQVFRERHGTA
jgi:hypothetical protein